MSNNTFNAAIDHAISEIREADHRIAQSVAALSNPNISTKGALLRTRILRENTTRKAAAQAAIAAANW